MGNPCPPLAQSETTCSCRARARARARACKVSYMGNPCPPLAQSETTCSELTNQQFKRPIPDVYGPPVVYRQVSPFDMSWCLVPHATWAGV